MQNIKSTNDFIKFNNNIIINKKHIRWVRLYNDCIKICTKQNGCTPDTTHTICDINVDDLLNKLNKN